MSDLVVVSLEPWDEVWRRNQHLVSGLLRADPGLRVLFVEPPDDPLHALSRRTKPEFGHRVHRIGDRLHALRPVKWLPRRLDPRADDRMQDAILRAAARLGMADPVLWINDPRADGLARRTRWRTLYDLTDDWLVADRPDVEMRRVAEGERWLLAHAAAVVACSPELARRKAAQREGIVVVRNGVDTAAYRAAQPRPADLPAGPVALYLGTLHRDRLDVELCMRTAIALGAGHGADGGGASVARGGAGDEDGGSGDRAGTVVLVGPNALDDADTARLQGAGVRILGARPRAAVIGYLQHADALLVPHVVTPFTESLDPLKLYEYQAVGRPVVSTPVAGFRDAAGPGILIADPDLFPGAVRQALAATATGSVAAVDPVAGADWSLRVAEMQRVLARAGER